MPTVHDVAKYILNKLAPKKNAPMTTWKLQKLVYYSQAWSLVWDERELFPDPIQAWADGPVCPALYQEHKGRLHLYAEDLNKGDPKKLDDDAVETIDAVLKHYGNKTGRYLSNLTHMERPWIEARGKTPPGIRSRKEISKEIMTEYYGGLQ